MFILSVFVSPYEPCLLDSVGHVLLVSSPTVFTHPLMQCSSYSTECLAVGLCIYSYQFMDDIPLMTLGLGYQFISVAGYH